MSDLAGDSDCAICFSHYDRSGHAARCLPCGHALCTRCLRGMLVTCQKQQKPDWQVTCPFCRSPTSLDAKRSQCIETSLPLDLGMWERVGPDPLTEGSEDYESPGLADTHTGSQPSGKWKAWKAFKKLLHGRDGRTRARTTRHRAIGHEDMRDLALMTCYII